MLKIWGRANSVNVQKVLWCCAELGLEFERVDAGMAFGVVDEPAYKNRNPNGRIPTIEDDGFVLWESNAIVRYLASKHGAGSLCPSDPQARADADRWMDWQATGFWAVLVPAFWGLVRTPEDQRDGAAIQASVEEAGKFAAILDGQLAGKDFVTGAAFTMADVVLGVTANRWFELPIERPDLANLAAWYGRLKQRPGFREYVLQPLT